MTLQEAIKIAETERKSKVTGAGDCGDRWVFSFEDDIGKTDCMPLFVYKENGKVEYFLMGFFMDSLIHGDHCIARHFQALLYGRGLSDACNFCKYQFYKNGGKEFFTKNYPPLKRAEDFFLHKLQIIPRCRI